MAINAPSLTTDFSGFLPPRLAQPIFERAARSTVVMQLTQQVPLGISGESIPVVTGRPSPGWVDEGAIKPATSGSLSLKTMTPKKIGAIMVVSAEVVRANPGNYLATMREALADAFAVAFDRAALHDEGPLGTAGGGPFASWVDQTTKTEELGTATAATGGIWKDLVNAMSDIVTDTDASGRRYRLTGWAFDDVVEPMLWGAVDTTGQPVFTYLPTNAESDSLSRPGRTLGRPSFMGEVVASANMLSVIGYGGDWTQAAWGVIGGINYGVSTEATVTINGALTSLWEHNLVAIRAEAEYGFLVNDPDAFT